MPAPITGISGSRGVVGVLALVAALVADPVHGQSPPTAASDARLQGVVVEESDYQPVASATVSILGSDLSVTTGSWGGFAFPDAPLGTISVQVSAPGHPSVVQEIEVRRDRIAFVQIVLPSLAAVLAEILVYGERPDGVSETARTAADLLALAVPRTRTTSGMVGDGDFQIRLRESTVSGNTEPLILIDGVVMTGSPAYEALRAIPASDVEDIEVLKGPAAAALYPYAASGVIRVTTKRGARGSGR